MVCLAAFFMLVYHLIIMQKTEPLLSAIQTIKDGRSLSRDGIANAFRVIMGGDATDGLIGAFLVRLRQKHMFFNVFGASGIMRF